MGSKSTLKEFVKSFRKKAPEMAAEYLGEDAGQVLTDALGERQPAENFEDIRLRSAQRQQDIMNRFLGKRQYRAMTNSAVTLLDMAQPDYLDTIIQGAESRPQMIYQQPAITGTQSEMKQSLNLGDDTENIGRNMYEASRMDEVI